MGNFFKQPDFCTGTDDKKKEWQELQNFNHKDITTIRDAVKNKDIPIDENWSPLFYTKLLRAKIQQRGDSDCYIRRLDDVATYLGRQLPFHKKKETDAEKERVDRLTLIYLMELSAICQLSASQGYSERARSIIKDVKHNITINYQNKETSESRKELASKLAPYEFYELWARYNIGIAYFHQREYRKAVLEFNWIIWQVKKWGEDINKGSDKEKAKAKKCLKFFSDVKNDDYEEPMGRELLLLPAILYRAEVQLKLQMAYHTLDTLNKHENEDRSDELHCWGSEHRRVAADIIKAQAYQQLGRLDKSWEVFQKALRFFGCNTNLGERRVGPIIPTFSQDNHRFLNLQERFISILIEDHLQWLSLDGVDDNDIGEDLRHLVKYGELIRHDKEGKIIKTNPCEDYTKEVSDFEDYLESLKGAITNYWKIVEHHADNRSGYFQQVAKYLGWLTKTADFRIQDCTDTRSRDARENIINIAKKLYKEAEREGILKEEPGMNSDEIGKFPKCLHDSEGIDLRRIEPEHYAWFTGDMLKFFESKTIKPDNGNQDKQYFIKRLIKLERKERNNLRINDLELHYKYYEPQELLKHGLGEELCWRGIDKEKVNYFSGLLKCAPEKNKELSSSDFVSHDYEKLMKDWDDYFVRHLEFPSIHELDTKKNQYYFVGLQRWNSSSPAKGYSVGGGYLLYHLDKNKQVDLGIAIDPGFDFVRNLFHSGFSLDDIDIILISHAHVDHIRDFESIITLIYELKKKSKRERRVHVILSLGTYERLKYIIESPGFRYFIEPYIIDIDREINEDYFEHLGVGDETIDFKFERIQPRDQEPNRQIERFRAVLPAMKGENNHRVKIIPTRAYHDDNTYYSDSFGFLIKLRKDDSEDKETIFGYTGDTKWIYPNLPDPQLSKEWGNGKRSFKDIAEQYQDCDALVVHLGSLIKANEESREYSFSVYDECKHGNNYNCEKLVCKENHPYLVGMLRLLSSLSGNQHNNNHGKPLIMISEFGEELKGNIRTDFVKRLQRTYEGKLVFLPVDVGMNVQLCRKDDELIQERKNKCTCKVWCVQCQKFVNISDADFEMYGNDNALYCVCRTCKRATPDDVLQTKLRKLYEVGYDINTKKDDDN